MKMNADIPLSPRERIISANGLQFSAMEWGESGQLPVLALHGWLDNAATFYRLAPLLKDLHLVAVDLAGHGQSEHRPGQGAYNLWDEIADVFAIADALGWQRFAFLGHSRGAIIATLAAGTFPERIIGVALVEGLLPEPAPTQDAPQQLAKAITALRDMQHKTRSVYPDLSVAIKARERGLFPLSHDAARALTERGVVARDGGFSWSTDLRLMAPSVMKLNKEQLTAFINRIQAPVKLVLAAEGLPQIYPGYIDEVNRFPQVDYEVLQGGHHLHLESEAPLVANIINAFFARLRDETGLTESP